jgi:magnesium-transporting ATPase (P-type)
VDLNQFLHAGAVMCNSEKVFALVIHTGLDCKINQNMETYSSKLSTLDKEVNRVFVVIMFFVFMLIFVAALVNKAFINRHRDSHTYLFEEAGPAREIATIGGMQMFLILLTLIPLQLIVIVDITKLFMTRTMKRDAWLMHPQYETNSIQSLKARSYNLQEELANVKYLFCDKTGTLT